MSEDYFIRGPLTAEQMEELKRVFANEPKGKFVIADPSLSYVKHFNELTPAEAERLALLVEECGEVIQAATKVLRHGWSSRNPLIDGSPTNRDDLVKEAGHLRMAILLMINAGDLDDGEIEAASLCKAGTINPWLHHNEVNISGHVNPARETSDEYFRRIGQPMNDE